MKVTNFYYLYLLVLHTTAIPLAPLPPKLPDTLITAEPVDTTTDISNLSDTQLNFTDEQIDARLKEIQLSKFQSFENFKQLINRKAMELGTVLQTAGAGANAPKELFSFNTVLNPLLALLGQPIALVDGITDSIQGLLASTYGLLGSTIGLKNTLKTV